MHAGYSSIVSCCRLTGSFVDFLSLVSVGGRSGWARKQSTINECHETQPPQPAGFVLAKSFTAKEAWMGNHAFLFGGKIMLGSDAPSLFFTNGLLAVGFGIYFGLLLPR